MHEPPICPYCNKPSKLVTGKEIYPKQPNLHFKDIWRCEPCQAHCGCHPGSTRPLGVPANAELRLLRTQVHRLLDPIWRLGLMHRKQAYRGLAQLMGIDEDACHVGQFNVDQCKQALQMIPNIKRPKRGAYAGYKPKFDAKGRCRGSRRQRKN